MEWQVALNNTSFDRAGITKDCKEAICEYIWNGFEAGATAVEVAFVGAPLKEAMSIKVKDDGRGVAFDTIAQTFGAFLSSLKNASSIRIKSQANKGKGRFSYLCFSPSAEWVTVYERNGKKKRYIISTSQVNRSEFSTSDISDVVDTTPTGTTVEFPLGEATIARQLSFDSIREKLLQEFSWFLYLNKSRNVALTYDGKTLDYTKYIDEELSADITIEISGEKFVVNLIVWKNNIDNSSKVYYLSENGEIHAARNTGFNKNTVGFFHNVFVASSYITSENAILLQDNNTTQTHLEYLDENRSVFGELQKEISAQIQEKMKAFLVRRADKNLAEMEKRGALPRFSQDEYGQLRKRDFETVTRELYCVEPRIFFKLNDQQARALLGFMNLLLSSEERENILNIVEQIVALTAEQRDRFATILQTTKLQFIVDAVGIIEKRIGIIAQLKQIVFDMAKFANERDHLQKIIEQHFWLFGEQYHLLSADKTLGRSLAEFEKITEVSIGDATMCKNEASQRADIFLYTARVQEDSTSEMIIVELKAPSVRLTEAVFAQVVRYANTIRKEKRFNGANRIWRFYAICAAIDDDVKTKFDNFKQYGRLGLANKIENFEIYALTWDDVFQVFEVRHNFLLSKLQIDLSQASASRSESTIQSPSRTLVNQITESMVDTDAQ